ncbi:thiamine-phosphate kinase [Lysinibacter cavernae]|uniref:Thiamine-monophosphate kinase n=1 Tax=Lysinibacter cavernae TaxID=1640652 RepID=A0A7X5QYK7_9MICO|nr:thiamine-phosphate kinase [Lysinibacter cavernae]NIH52380.1 thiamine-monophosphate kinase [Lysinibacter cavernae]
MELPATPAATQSSSPRVSDLSEGELLQLILAQFHEAKTSVVGPGDDAAVLAPGGNIVITTDMMIEGPDFRRAWHSGFELGWKAAATNLSDVAAMGARPSGLTVALASPSDVPAAYLVEIARGFDAACQTLAPGCGVVGGDLSTAPVLSLSITALGNLEGRQPVLRSGAQPGDVVAVAGDLGLAAAGLSLLFDRCVDASGAASAEGIAGLWAEHPELLAAQLAPSPPIPLGIEAAQHGASSMIDISDSLSLDASRVARASGVSINLFRDQLGAYADDALTGGEDHALLATFLPGSVPHGFRVIGEVGPLSESPLSVDGVATVGRGWDPFDSSRR